MKKVFMTVRLTLLAFILMSTPVYSGGINAYDPSGTWDVEIEVPGQTVDGVITIAKNDKGEFEVSIEDTTENETKELEEVSYDEESQVMTGEISVEGQTLEIELEFDGDSLEGTISVEGMEISITGERE